jgi:valyl-tRNA synthetase
MGFNNNLTTITFIQNFMEKTYSPQEIEQRWYQRWEKSGYFKPAATAAPAATLEQNTYCIMLPPPNVTGTLHMGHGFQVSLMDALIRYRRMCGDNTLWQAGTDHAGIATQMVVERQLLQTGKTRHDLGRDAFVAKTWEWKHQSDSTIKNQLRRMGASLDWTRERFSLDDDINRAVVEVFVSLHEQGLIYRGKRLVNWDPTLHTAISDLEVLSQEEEGSLWYLRYPLVNSHEVLIVATTRPETLLGDTAVAVHPDDIRYQHLIGQLIQHPLTGRTIPIIADDYVDASFGTGCVKITPAHDFNDYAMGQRHKLPLINIFTHDAHINEQAPEKYRGLERYAARKQIIEDLTALHLVEKIQAHKLQVPRGEKSGVVIEPYLTDQWYIKTKPLAEPAIAAVKNGDIQFVPENWNKTYFQWLENIEDWCISRQLWWGHRIPAWYDEAGNVYVGANETQIREKHQLGDIPLRQDEDVLDTWFSASLWPFATLGWPEQTAELTTFYPTHVLLTGFDILFFWVARMVMMGLKFTGKVPFKTVYVTGLIRDSEGQKMSKSKGNVLDPIDLIDGIDLDTLLQKRTYGLMQSSQTKKIEQSTRQEFPSGIRAFGTDALRFTYCALANTGRDIRFDLGRLEGYRNFCNKLWNAARYVLMNVEGGESSLSLDNPPSLKFQRKPPVEGTLTAPRCEPAAHAPNLPDRWIRSQLQKTIQSVTQHFANYRFDLLAQTLYEFTWNEYCDWYLEFSKPVLVGENASEAAQQSTRETLIFVLEALLRLIHPLMPFITEEIWQRIAPLAQQQGETLMLQPYPVFEATQIDAEATADIEWLKTVILNLRQIRAEMNISPKKSLPLLLQKGTAQDKERLARNKDFLITLAKLESLTWLDDTETPPPAAIALVDKLELLIPLAGVIDQSAELARLAKEFGKLEKDLIKIQSKLANENYLAKAPIEVVNKERENLQEVKQAMEKIQMQQNKLAAN